MRLSAGCLLLSSALLIAGCAVDQEAVRRREAQLATEPKRVAVIAALGERFHGVRVATTVFGNIHYEAAAPDWEVGTRAAEAAVRYLRGRKELEVERLDLQHGDDGVLVNREAVFEQARAKGFDTVVLLQTGRHPNHPFLRPGFGFFQRTFLGVEYSHAYALIHISTYHLASGSFLGRKAAWPYGPKETEVPWRERFDEYSDAERSRLKVLIQGHVDKAVFQTVEDVWADSLLTVREDALRRRRK